MRDVVYCVRKRERESNLQCEIKRMCVAAVLVTTREEIKKLCQRLRERERERE